VSERQIRCLYIVADIFVDKNPNVAFIDDIDKLFLSIEKKKKILELAGGAVEFFQ